MTTLHFSKRINASQEKVWEVISNLGYIQNYNPSVIKSYYVSENTKGVGASRICELAPFGKLEEKASEWKDGESFTLNLIPIEKLPPFKDGKATLKLKEIDGKTTQVTVDFSYEMNGIFGSALNSLVVKKQFETGLTGLLDGLKLHVETGKIIENRKSLKAA